MKREFVFGGLIALALSVGAAAQSTTAQTATQDKDKDTVTITGCLVPSAGGAVGTSGTTAATAPASGGFMLINASKDKDKDAASAATTTAGTSGTTAAGTTASAAEGKSYTLVGGDPSDLQKWVNSRVEIKGTVEEGSSATPPMTAGSTAAGAEKSPAQKLRITSAKQVASTCSGQ